MPVDPLRAAISQVLVLAEDHKAHPRLGPLIQEHGATLSPQDQRLLREVALGVHRNRSLLDRVIRALSRSHRLPRGEALAGLRSGLYQLLFLHRVSRPAVVDLTVGVIRAQTDAHVAGFANAVLRKVATAITPLAADAPERADPRQLVIEREDSAILVRLPQPLLPDPAVHPAEFLAVRYSHPPELVQRWLRRYPFAAVQEIAASGSVPPATHLRVNPLRTTRDALAAALQAEGCPTEPGRHPLLLRVLSSAVPIGSQPFRAGWCTVQDTTALSAVDLLDPKPGQRVLDLCAAPGTKTTAIAERMGDRGEVFAFDADPERLRRVTENAERLGLGSIRLLTSEAELTAALATPFDRVLIDAPCSNTGVLGRRVEARWRFSAAALKSLETVQRPLLVRGLSALAPKGVLVWSTCSLEPEENEGLVATTPLGGRVLVEQLGLLPLHPYRDGGWAGKITAE